MTIQHHDYLGTPADVIAVANAIARAEGFYVAKSIPQVHNNPGDLENHLGQKIVFATEADGWGALYKQVELMISGRSKIYNPSMSWTTIGAHYDGEVGYMDWVNNICKELGVQSTQTLQQFVDSFNKIKPIGIAVTDSINMVDSVG